MKRKSIAALTAATLVMVPSISSAATVNIQKDAKPDDLTKSSNEKKKSTYIQKQKRERAYSTDTFIIKYSSPINKRVHQKAGVKVIRSLPALGYDVIKIGKKQQPKEVLSYYLKQKDIRGITPSVQYKQLGGADPKKADMYHLQLLQIEKALQLAGNKEVKVAVIDGGMDSKHPDLKSQILPPYNAAAPANAPVPDLHGTHVAGIIGSAAGNGVGGHGIHPKAKILPIDVFNGEEGASDYVIAEGVLKAIEQKADVINMSLGGYMNSPVLEEAVKKAIETGITVVAAAGNESTDAYSTPASYEGVISVGSVNQDKLLSDYSNYGPSVDIVAPGEDVYSTAFDLRKGSTYMKLSGTSMASPVVAGVAALLKSKHPDLTPYQVETILERTATDLGDKGYDLTYANGLVNPVAALQYDVKKVPKKEELTVKAMHQKAKQLKAGGSEEKGSITIPEQKHLYKVNLQEGEYVQTMLDGSKNFDYGLDLYFFPEGKEGEEVEPIKVNDMKASEQEAYLFSAKEAGTLIIAVKDVNGHYSLDGQSQFQLKVETSTDLKTDDTTFEKPAEIKEFPFQTKEYTLFNEEGEGDSDYFTFTVKEPTMLSFSTTGVPGVDATMNLYMGEDENGEPLQVQSTNTNGMGKGEKLAFEAIPEIQYTVEVTNESTSFTSIISLLLSGGSVDMDAPGGSLKPYELKAEAIQLPEDEDGLPMIDLDLPDEEFELDGTDLSTKEIAKRKEAEKKLDLFSLLTEMENEGEHKEMVESILKNAIPFQIGKDKKGYLQQMGDIDYYTFTVDENAYYEFGAKNEANALLSSTIFEYDEETNDLIPLTDMMGGLDILALLFGMPEGDGKTRIALEKGKKYFLSIKDDEGNILADPYTLQAKKVMKAPAEDDRDQNKPIRAKVMKPGEKYKNYFIYNGDIDYYYYKNRGEDRIASIKARPIPFTTAERQKMPKELQNRLFLSGAIVEDLNGNMRIDDNEQARAIPLSFDPFTLNINASFKAKKDVGYFMIVENEMNGVSPQPYTVQLFDLHRKDEDAGSKLVNGVPTKPLPLKKEKNSFVGKGHINVGVDFGDRDYYQLHVDRNSTVNFTLTMEDGLDGKLVIYNAQGKQVTTFNQYGNSDPELGTLQLPKGNYYVEVSETHDRATTQPYTLTITTK
ncbi:subtilisin family serine protease [Oikeobacillus pervagus]|uniref:Subtilisin family serine protease n=1 Tax=Oikeobacillus pervagus TaxID=1325931 RepID=A0AAJ1T353_9BACI|nr:S8 family peptidase [Oikeobacillus pervagus]MDQ0215917.1 subtilisin family serine protease [Oikeobacillus pervagus]